MNQKGVAIIVISVVAIIAIVGLVLLFSNTGGTGYASQLTSKKIMPKPANKPPRPVFFLSGAKTITYYPGAAFPIFVGDASGERDIASVTLRLNKRAISIKGLEPSGINARGVVRAIWYPEAPGTRINLNRKNMFQLIMTDTAGQEVVLKVPLVILEADAARAAPGKAVSHAVAHSTGIGPSGQATDEIPAMSTPTPTPASPENPTPTPSATSSTQEPTSTPTSTPTETPTPTPSPACKCITMDVKSEGTADGDLNYIPALGGNKLGPLKIEGPTMPPSFPFEFDYYIAYAFEVTANVEGDPDQCAEGQFAQSTSVEGDQSVSKSDSSGINAFNPNGDAGVLNPEGIWAPDDFNGPDEGNFDEEKYVLKEHDGTTIRWYDAPGTYYPQEAIRPLEHQSRLEAVVENSEGKGGCACIWRTRDALGVNDVMEAEFYDKECWTFE